jgi:hypothetical protein
MKSGAFYRAAFWRAFLPAFLFFGIPAIFARLFFPGEMYWLPLLVLGYILFVGLYVVYAEIKTNTEKQQEKPKQDKNTYQEVVGMEVWLRHAGNLIAVEFPGFDEYLLGQFAQELVSTPIDKAVFAWDKWVNRERETGELTRTHYGIDRSLFISNGILVWASDYNEKLGLRSTGYGRAWAREYIAEANQSPPPPYPSATPLVSERA